MDRGAWWVIVHRVAQSRTQLSDQAQHSSTCGSQTMLPKPAASASASPMNLEIQIFKSHPAYFGLCNYGNQQVQDLKSMSLFESGDLKLLKHRKSGSVVKNPSVNARDTEVGWISGTGRYPGGGNGNLVQYSCLENSMD